MFYHTTRKERLDDRNKLFVSSGIPALQKKGFNKSPFSVFVNGRDHLKNFSYTLCRISKDSLLEFLTVYIARGDRRLKIELNIFQLSPVIQSIDQLQGLEGLQFCLPPNSCSKMQLRQDDYKFIPFYTVLFAKQYRIRRYLTKWGYKRRLRSLEKMIKSDMTNIDCSVIRWHELHQPMSVTWEGHAVETSTTSHF